ncbi:MAG: glycosyltransferase [Rhodobacteraceae bacterium]|nr:glycosyltransferase [Paracoccaceae bacterium]
MRGLIVVTHLLGTGHLSRALTLARAFTQAGDTVQVLSGGFPAPQLRAEGVDLRQLPALRSDGVNFTRLLTPEGGPADEDYLARRTDALLAHAKSFNPDILITELFPFGRRILTAEFEAVLGWAQSSSARPLILSSIRDILAPPSKPEKAAKADQVIDRYYDGVLVHSDPQVMLLANSWPVSDRLQPKLHYTGYVAPAAPAPHPDRAGEGEILVSAGGGSVGDSLYACAAEAAHLMSNRRWRLLIGGTDAESRITQLKTTGTPAILEPARPDFRQMLRHAAASVSMCGYNTAMDLLQTGIPSVILPFDAGDEVEQTLRADALKHLPGFDVIRQGDLTPERLCAAVQQVMAAPNRPTDGFGFDGAAQAVEIAHQLRKDAS